MLSSRNDDDDESIGTAREEATTEYFMSIIGIFLSNHFTRPPLHYRLYQIQRRRLSEVVVSGRQQQQRQQQQHGVIGAQHGSVCARIDQRRRWERLLYASSVVLCNIQDTQYLSLKLHSMKC